MGINNWTPDQWRAYNAKTGDRHVARALPPLRQHEVLKEDLVQQQALFRISRRKDDCPDAYKRREMAFVRLTVPMTYAMDGNEHGD